MKSTFKKQMFVQAKNRDLNVGQTSNTFNPQCFVDPATYMSNGEFVFRIPPEAPVFEPTVEEFLDPLAYINKIRPIAEKTGICKVKPPPEWHPPFAVDVDHFKFTPRIQKLNELDANTRVKLYFLDRLATYWSFSGVQIRIPAIDDKTVDMYSLYKIVELEGGFEKINIDRKWTKIASRMGYVNEKNVALQLKSYYKRLLLPYEKFEKMKLKALQENESNKNIKKEFADNLEIKIELGCNKNTMKPVNTLRRCTRSSCDENSTEILVSDTFKNPEIQDKNKELQRLTFYGPGPKILGSNKSKINLQNTKKEEKLDDLLADSTCMMCGKGDSEENILLCDGCDDGYHTFCLIPPLNSIPKGEWRCPKCIAVVVSKAADTTFGFEQAEREYSLQQFGEMADQFKSNYFNMPVHLVPMQKVEQEYWKILSSMDSNVNVEYGADLHSMDHGSGFPTQMALKQSGDENHYYKSYVESSWNLNNIPVLEGSVLGYINADISGMKIPWMYVGMCFSTFCWHNEDHWSYSINYLHWGEPKTWYGVPGFMAEQFEQVMQETTPDLFRNQPDLLHQLVTILNPNILMDKGVPVYHIDQAAGEFVLTFPRAYHAGFNHGYNFAEAVNFAPVDWIPLGRECVKHYSSLHRYCVFSHDELVCKMASVPENLNSKLASATHQDMLKMLDLENKQRKELLEWGVMNSERETFELLADDERQCAECNTTCFLSAVVCKCSPKKVTCLRHFKEHCLCPPSEHTLHYRYTLDELPVMLEKLKEKADSAAAWAAKVHDALDINTPRTLTLSGLKDLLHEANEKHFPDDLSLNLLSKSIKSVQDALAVDFKNILSHKQTLNKKVTLMEIKSYYEELQRIPCVLPQENTVKHFLKFVEEFQRNVEKVLNNDLATVNDVENILKQGQFPNVEIPSIDTLKNYKKVLNLIEKYKEKQTNTSITFTLDMFDQLLAHCQNINNPNSLIINISNELTILKEKIVTWEQKASNYLNVTLNNTYEKPPLYKLEKLLEEAKSIEAFLPSRDQIITLVQKTLNWKKRANSVFQKNLIPFVELIESLVEDGCNIEVELDEMTKLRSIISKTVSWKEEVYWLFLGDCKAFSLLEILMPRKNLQRICKYKTNVDDQKQSILTEHVDLLGTTNFNSKEDFDLDEIISSFKVAEKREFELMRALRVKNTYKKKQTDGKFCICDNLSTVNMKECTLCKDLFHEQCLKQLENYWEDKKQDSHIFLCIFCQRSRRPNSKFVSNALTKLQKLQIQTLESVAMQCLLDREVKWKESVNELLNTPELCTLLDQKSKTAKLNMPIMLSNENKNNLESLLFRGFLLELELPENEIIYKILHKLDNNLDHSYQSMNSSISKTNIQLLSFDKTKVEMELNNETCSLKNELSGSFALSATKEKKRKYSTFIIENNENDEVQALHCQFDNSYDSSISVISRKKNRKSLIPLKKISVMKTKQECTGDELQKSKHNSTLIFINSEKSCEAKNLIEEEEEDEEEEEEETECDAKKCVRPVGEHVDWVQCDYCKNWLHMVCIGVTKMEVDNQTEFMCSLCKNTESSKLKNSDNDEDDDDVVFIEYTSNNAAVCSS